MIINLGGRTDIANYYSEWFINRIKEGFVYVRNPYYPEQITKYLINPQVIDLIVVCSKNPRPLMKQMEELREYKLLWFYTITPYAKDIEPNVPNILDSIETFKELAKKRQTVIWRYDPIFITEKYDFNYHVKTFGIMCESLEGYTDRCIFSFVQMYEKLKINFRELKPVDEEIKNRLIEKLSNIAKRYNITLQSCATNEDYSKYGVKSPGCVTQDLIEVITNRNMKNVTKKPNREYCECIHMNDIGQYTTCINGCKYCYANKNYHEALSNYKKHDESSPLLIGNIQEGDIIHDANQETFLEDFKQLALDLEIE